MNGEELRKKFYEEFSSVEIAEMGKGPMTTASRMENGDKMILKDEFLDYLMWFFDDVYEGAAIPKVFDKVLIEVTEGQPQKYYVTFFENHPGWYAIDVFVENIWWIKIVDFNRDMTPEDFNEDIGRYCPEYVVLSNNKLLDQKTLEKMASHAKNVYMYAFLYAKANLDNPEITYVETRYYEKTIHVKGTSKKGNPVFKKQRVSVPQEIRFLNLHRTQTGERKAAEYVVERWKVKAHTRKGKDGKEISIKEYIAHRHYPNKGVDGTLYGTDYVLRARKED